MVVPLLLIMVLPKLMNAADADTQKVKESCSLFFFLYITKIIAKIPY